jgi:hypothetical protein
MAKESKLSKLQQWLKDDDKGRIGSKNSDSTNEKINIIQSLLEDTLSQLKCTLKFDCLSGIGGESGSDLNPVTLKFKSNEYYCERHRKRRNKGLINLLRYFKANNDVASLNHDHSYSNANEPSSNVNQQECILCNSGKEKNAGDFSEFAFLNREKLYNKQPSQFYFYNIGMCLVIFLAMMSVLLIVDLDK